jgi:hypothetical protein
MSKEVLARERHQFFSRCYDSLRKRAPKNYCTVPSIENLLNSTYYKFYEPLDWVHFEWHFHNAREAPGNGFSVALDFENDVASERNQAQLESFREIKGPLQAAFGEEVYFISDRRRGWTRVSVWTADKDMTDELANRAVEKATIMIQHCEPKLKNLPGYRC